MPQPITGVLETVLYCTSENEGPTRRFYEEVLGLRPVSRSAYRIDDQVVLIFNSDESTVQKEPPPHGARGSVHTCFLVEPDAYESWKAHLTAGGTSIVDEITWDNGIRSFYFKDPAGNMLEIADGDMWPHERST